MMQIRWKLALTLAVCSYPLHLRGAQADDQERAANYADAGQRALATGHYAEARQNFEQLAKLEPDIAEVHAALAAIYFKLREYELSVQEVRTTQKPSGHRQAARYTQHASSVPSWDWNSRRLFGLLDTACTYTTPVAC